MQVDVTDRLSVQALAKRALEFGGVIDVWFSNVGVGAVGLFHETRWRITNLLARRGLREAAPPAVGPLALIGREGRRRTVMAANLAAQVLGVRPGLPAAEARAHCAELIVEDADPEGDLRPG